MRLADLHNIINHFTFALINLGVLFEVFGYAFKHEGLRRFSWDALRLGVGFAILSIVTGYLTQANLGVLAEEAVEVVTYHKTFSWIAVAIVAATVILRMATPDEFLAEVKVSAIRGAYFTLLVLSFLLTSISGWLGMELTYSHGVNVRPYERILEALPPRVTRPADELGIQPLPNDEPATDTVSR